MSSPPLLVSDPFLLNCSITVEQKYKNNIRNQDWVVCMNSDIHPTSAEISHLIGQSTLALLFNPVSDLSSRNNPWSSFLNWAVSVLCKDCLENKEVSEADFYPLKKPTNYPNGPQTTTLLTWTQVAKLVSVQVRSPDVVFMKERVKQSSLSLVSLVPLSLHGTSNVNDCSFGLQLAWINQYVHT